MTILNSIQYREYNRALALTRFFNETKSIYASFTPFRNEVTSFLCNVKQVPDYAAVKEKNGTSATVEKRKLKQAIAREGAYLCNMATAYALNTGNNTLLYAVAYTYTDIFTLRDANLSFIGKVLSDAITPFLDDEKFKTYGITATHLTSITEKGEEYLASIGKASILNNASDYASQTITATLNKIKGNIAQFNRLLHFFSAEHQAFVTGFQEACLINNMGVGYNAVEGTIKDSCIGQPVAGVTITGEGKNKIAVTNALGFYRLAGIKTGTYTLTIASKGYTTEVVTVKVVRGKTIELNINLKAQPINFSSVEAA